MRWPCLTILTAVVLIGCPHYHERPDDGRRFQGCIEGTEPPPLELIWHHLPGPDSTVELVGGVASLTVRNNTQAPVTIDVSIGGALDDVREMFDLPELVVEAGSEVVTKVDLASFETDLADLDFSGRMVAKGFARLAGSGQVLDLVYSPHVFFHVAQGKVVAYRETTLVERFNAGDYAGRASYMRAWAAKRGLRIAGVGRLGGGLELTDDDGGPKEVVPVP